MKKYLRTLYVPFALPAVGLVRLLGRFGYMVRFGELWSERLGHLAGNMACYLTQRKPGLDLFFHREPPANETIARLLARRVIVDPTGFTRVCCIVNALFPGSGRHVAQPAQVDRDIFNLIERSYPVVRF